ncbi:CFS1-like protein [Punctularia strigosozonata HHB-11173 SS5]|uniref:CFS1-like protein n=1 Tax=Punctularia strigosozonata (strain HHB-11173) TaxID=741275 RepID=UPI0004416437|nr:CFS1-like protein [Punctularia strigosozonata HHB-11173 SS5]EIN11137.1 CFS1-like protein [Punctularia strigosozonata HHB-11173 SS5]
MRIALFSDLGLAEGYMDGDFECDDISALIQIIIANRSELDTDNILSTILARGRNLTATRFLGNLTNSRANISAHYDLSNDMFEAFLSEDMCYSSAIFKDFTEDLSPKPGALESLEDAQMRKMRYIIELTEVKPGHRVLEFGTGWASLSILLAQTVDCIIDTVTLSVHQATLARRRIADAGLSDRITVHLMDYRQCLQKSEWAGAFDRFVSVEMIENVGREFIAEYWGVVDWAMKPRDSAGCVQVITMPESRIPAYDQGVDFIQKWIFPGCYIPSFEFLVSTLAKGSGGRLTVDTVRNIGPHYARTLREWKRKFLRNWDEKIAQALVEEYSLTADDLDVFRRKWIYYFDYCEAGFATRSLGDHIFTFAREGYVKFGNQPFA